MQMKLKIGAYEVSHDPAASTTTGVKLFLPEGVRVTPTKSRTNASVVFGVEIKAASNAALKTAIDELETAVTATAVMDVVFESDAGTEFLAWRVSTGEYSRVVGNVAVDARDVDAVILVTFDAERIAPVNTGAGDQDGSIDAETWSVGQDASGQTSVTATLTFKDRTSIVAWLAAARAKTAGALPPWLHSDFNVLTWRDDLTLEGGQPSPVTDSAWKPCTIQVFFTRMSEAVASALQALGVVDFNCDTAITPREPLDKASGEVSGSDVLISGTLQFKTETDTTWDSGDTDKTALSAIDQAARDAVAVLAEDAKTRSASDWTQTELLITHSGKGGVAFTYHAIKDLGNIWRWVESTQVVRSSTNRKLQGSLAQRVFVNRSGAKVSVTHSLLIESFEVVSYSPPEILNSGEWDELSFTPTKPVVMGARGLLPETTVYAWAGSWERVNSGTETGGGYEYGDVTA